MPPDDGLAELARSRSLAWGEQLAAAARKGPSRVALYHGSEQTRTYAGLDERASRLANALAARGVRAGDRVALLMTNRLEFVESLFAGWRLGAIMVPINFRLLSEEIADILVDCGAEIALVDVDLAPGLGVARARATAIRCCLVVGGAAEVAGPGSEDYETTLVGASPEPPGIAVDDQEPAVICYTSGTTGRPKGAVLTHKNLALNALSVMVALGVSRDDEVWASGSPLFHIGGFGDMLPYIMLGGGYLILPSGTFDAAETVDLLERIGVTGCVFVPTQWQAICAVPGLKERRLPMRRVAWSSAPSPLALLQLLAETFPGVDQINGFGQTELSPVTTVLNGEDAERKMGSVGRPVVNVELRIVDAELRDVPVGEVGEVVYRGPCVFAGYWNRPETEDGAFAGGWFHSGDLCRMDDEGYIYVVDRLKDMIVSGGENIYSAEVESAISTHPLVSQVAVVGLPHERWGESPCAVIVPEDSERPPTEDEIVAYCRANLASYKKPTRVVIVPRLPTNASGKVLKHVLREQLSGQREATVRS